MRTCKNPQLFTIYIPLIIILYKLISIISKDMKVLIGTMRFLVPWLSDLLLCAIAPYCVCHCAQCSTHDSANCSPFLCHSFYLPYVIPSQKVSPICANAWFCSRAILGLLLPDNDAVMVPSSFNIISRGLISAYAQSVGIGVPENLITDAGLYSLRST